MANRLYKLGSVMQGEAQVYWSADGSYIGYVVHLYGDGDYLKRGWYSYDKNKKLISTDPAHKRGYAINQVLNAAE